MLQHKYVLCLLALAYIPLPAQTSLSGIDVSALDKAVSPCSDFYQYACGTWIKNNPIPPDQARWGKLNELTVHNEQIERHILEQAAKPTANRTPLQQKIGDYYAACMDEATIERKGITPIKSTLDDIASIRARQDLTDAVIRLHRDGIRAFFQLQVRPDDKDATRYIAILSQGGLSMPDRDYYFDQDAKTVEIRRQYRAHLNGMFELLGDNALDAERHADAVLDIETALAKNSMDRTVMRNPDNTYHKMPVDQLAALAPNFDWRDYLAKLGVPAISSLNVMQPDFIRGLEQILSSSNIDDLKTYLRWQTLHSTLNLRVGLGERNTIAVPLLPRAFSEENWNFNEHILNGVQEEPPRSRTCVRMVDDALGEALGQEFVRVAFTPASKERTLHLVADIEAEMAKVIRSAEWMSGATRVQALTKLRAVANKIGYPDKWRDYANVKVLPDDAVGNLRRSAIANRQERLGRIGQIVDKTEWNMTPPTVNAYYHPTQNNINFPAGILQPPFFNPNASDAVNYGAIGHVIGHEITHGFDDQGRRYDSTGNLRDWWTAEDGRAFESRAACFVKEYGGFSPVSGVTLNGKLTLGENTADNGGVRLAYMALMNKLAGHPLDKADGFSPEQQFFLGFAQVSCGTTTDEWAHKVARTDPHSPGKFRVNGVVQNMPEFSRAWGCKAGDAMVSEIPCRVW